MEKLLLRIWIFVLAFGLGISISAIWRIYTLPALPEPVIETIEVSQVVSMPREIPQIIGERHSCGASRGPEVYNYTDGGRVTVYCPTYQSSAAAAQALQRRLRGATIEEQSLNIDSNGDPLGEEILITAPTISRLRRNGQVLCEVEASSYNHLIWFEKRLKNGNSL